MITREAMIDFTAKSISASSITIAGAFPPNSKDTFVILGAAAAIVCCPALTLPVRLTMPTFGFAANSWPITEPRPFTKLKTPAGKPTSSTICAKTYAFSGVSWLGFTTIVLPVIKAGAALRATRKKGKFQGRIPVVTPIAFLNRNMLSRGRSLGMISPSYRRAHPAI